MDYRTKIKLAMNMYEMISNKRMPTDKEWDKYFIDNYNDNTLFIWSGDDFLSYEVFSDHVFIYDFVGRKNGISLIKEAFRMADDLKLPVRCTIHVANIHMLNVAMHRYGFKIKELAGIQFLMEKKWADHHK